MSFAGSQQASEKASALCINNLHSEDGLRNRHDVRGAKKEVGQTEKHFFDAVQMWKVDGDVHIQGSFWHLANPWDFPGLLGHVSSTLAGVSGVAVSWLMLPSQSQPCGDSADVLAAYTRPQANSRLPVSLLSSPLFHWSPLYPLPMSSLSRKKCKLSFVSTHKTHPPWD